MLEALLAWAAVFDEALRQSDLDSIPTAPDFCALHTCERSIDCYMGRCVWHKPEKTDIAASAGGGGG